MSSENIKAKVEATLFLTEKPLRAQAIARIVESDVDLVRRILIELIESYEQRDGGLEVADDDGYIIQVKDDYTNLIDEFVPLEMPTALVRTLSAIALKQPVAQSEVIKLRGGGAYEHIKELMERELVNKKDEGRSPILTTTKKFQEYFRLSKDGNSLRLMLSKDEEQKRQDIASRESDEEAEIPVTTFDASPDPLVPPIGIPGEQQLSSRSSAISKRAVKSAAIAQVIEEPLVAPTELTTDSQVD